MRNHHKNDELSTIRQQLNRIQAQLYRNEIPQPQELTIDNKSGKKLKFTINLDNNQYTSSNIVLNSQISIPNNSSLTHVLQADYTNHNNMQKSHLMARYATNHGNFDESHANYVQKSNFTMRQQQKFLPISRLSIDQQSQRRKNKQQLERNKYSLQHQQKQQKFNRKSTHGNQILITDQDDQDQSQIKKDQEINQMVESYYVKNPYTTQRKKQQNYEQKQENSSSHQQSHIKIEGQIIESVSLPFTMKKSSKTIKPDTSQTAQKQQKQDSDHYENVRRSLALNFNSLQTSNMKKSGQNVNKQWKVQLINPVPKRVSVKIQNQKTYSEILKQKQSFKKNKKSQRESRLYQRLKTTIQGTSRPKNSHSRCISKVSQVSVHKTSRISKKQNKETSKADDLFIQRKDEYLRKLQKEKNQINYIRKHSNSKDKFITIDFNKLKNKSPQKTVRISPMIEQIGNRLHSSKAKLPCEHYKKFSKSQQRQRFNLLVKQNIYVSRYISRDEREQLFQSLLKSQDSISLWPTKIANYTMIKMKRVADSMRHDFY